MSKCECGSYAINPNLFPRTGEYLKLCDVCYFKKRLAETEQRLAEIEAKLPRWIPVTERLPKPGATILAVDNSGDMGVCNFVNARFVGECFGFEVYLNDGGWDRSPSKVIGEYVTHWMTPEPPESRKEK